MQTEEPDDYNKNQCKPILQEPVSIGVSAAYQPFSFFFYSMGGYSYIALISEPKIESLCTREVLDWTS